MINEDDFLFGAEYSSGTSLSEIKQKDINEVNKHLNDLSEG